MKLLDRMEKRFGHLAVPNVVLVLIVAQLFLYAAIIIGRVDYVSLLLIPKAVMGGEWWRLITFLLAPPSVAVTLFQGLFLAFFWYVFWMMSSALESAWGVFRFNIYLLCGILFSIAGALLGQLISPGATIVVSPQFLYLSVFFAFATLNPNIQFLVLFVIPMKVKWLAWIVAGFTVLSVLGAPSMGDRLAILAPLLNYVFFFRDVVRQSVQSGRRRSASEKEKSSELDSIRHVCSECGGTERSCPERDFRYKMIDGNAVCICDVCREL
ncbi:MAG: hypothetical protein ACI81V_000526 [Lentimonas sp.]|jgi:hypothetical protein